MKLCLKMTGCKNNRYELDRIILWCAKNGVELVTDESAADYCVINTCTVTQSADRKSRQMIRKTKNQNPSLKVVVFGCAARMQKKAFEKIKEIDHLFSDLKEVLDFLDREIQKTDIRTTPLHCVPAEAERSRALVQIQDGCDSFCAYCIIAAARGKSKNRPVWEILDEIRAHEKAGFNEVILTGINIGAYGASRTTRPKESRLQELLESILRETSIARIRLSSLGPEFFNGRLHQVLQNPRICRHIHLSVQSGSDSVLKRMRRRYTVSLMDRLISRLKKDIPGIAITADIIVGFPEETEKEFKETIAFVKRHQLAKVHVFPYSIRANTVAAKMEQIPDTVRKKRAKTLQKTADRYRQKFIQNQLGKRASVLWCHGDKPGTLEGITDHYIRVRPTKSARLRSVGNIRLTKENVIWE